MSQFFDQASLVMVPSGYKNGKVYSQKPLSADGELTFSRASTATRVNASGLIEEVASGLPRLDYSGGCPSLLLEPQRTNLANWSEQADKYLKVGATIGSNLAVSPDGYTNADSIIEDGTSGPHAFYNFGIAVFSAQAYTTSVFAKKGGRDWFSLSFYDGTTDKQAFFNLANGTAGSVSAGATSTITSIGNGWYRCTITATATPTGGGLAIYSANAEGSTSYAGTNGLNAGYFYGWQVEAGAYATSYIGPTLSTAVTRVAESASKTGISSLIGQTEGTLFAEFNYEGVANNAIGERIIAVGDGTDQNRIVLLKNPSGTGTLYLYVGSGGSAVINETSITGTSIIGGTHKVAVAYKSGEYAVYFNGASVFTSSAAVVPATSAAFVGSDETGAVTPLSGGIKQALLFKTRLPNSDLATLTSL